MDSHKYELTRTVRFNLTGTDIDSFGKLPVYTDSENLFSNFIKIYAALLKSFEDALFYNDSEGVLKIKSRVEIKKSWLRQYARQSYYQLPDEDRSKGKLLARYFELNLLNWLKRNKAVLEITKSLVDRPENDQSRRSEFSFILKTLTSHEYFPFIETLSYANILNDKDSNQFVAILQEATKRFGLLLDQMHLTIASDLNQGLEVCRASFNYYAVNKISKNFDKDFQIARDKLNRIYRKPLDVDFLETIGFIDYLHTERGKDITVISLQDLYDTLKMFKSSQKRSFTEMIQNQSDRSTIIQRFPLFKTKKEDVLVKFLTISNEIQDLANKKKHAKQSGNNIELAKITKAIDDKKRKARSYFQNPWGFLDYIKYCNIFKSVAIDIGELKAIIRNFEQEKVDAQLLRYWANIVLKDGQYSLLLIPKENMNEVKVFLDTLPVDTDKDDNYTIYSFNSITLHSLSKLIRRNLKREQIDLGEESKAINLYKKVLQNHFSEIRLDCHGFEDKIIEICSKNYANEEEFRIALEQISYFRDEKMLSADQINHLQSKQGAKLLHISSFDFERNIVGDPKEHSRLWKDCWHSEDGFRTRINPELKIFYRPKRYQYDSKKQRNRFSKDHFGVAFTITQNAALKRLKSGYASEKPLIDMINRFNNEIVGDLVKERGDDLYYYGIDRGTTELATLCLVQFSEKRYKVKLADEKLFSSNEPRPCYVNTYRIKDEHLHQVKNIATSSADKILEVEAFKNPSYFIDDDIFEVERSACMDLTTAKLISGKIILNGDTQTYINLKKVNAKRQLFNNLFQIDKSSNIEFDEVKREFQIKSKGNEHKAYQSLIVYPKSLESSLQHKEILQDLETYLDRLRSGVKIDEDISIEKINHLRDAITSNMVGIISSLFESYPGVINLENMHSKNEIERHFRNNNENISRRLEWSLYRKFQKTGLVPPSLRQTIFLHEADNKTKKAKIDRFGIIQFIPIEGTSASCPKCGEKTSMPERDKDKFDSHTYTCKGNTYCGFNTQSQTPPFEFIRNSDDVAAYNIAKRGLAYIQASRK